MLHSMTGYGKAQVEDGKLRVSASVHVVNGKFFDLECKLSDLLLDQEHHWRKLLAEKLRRGRCTLIVSYESRHLPDGATRVDRRMLRSYYRTLKQEAEKLEAPLAGLFPAILQLPDVVVPASYVPLPASHRESVEKAVMQALEHCLESRTREGAFLQQKIDESMGEIAARVQLIAGSEKTRNEQLTKEIRDKFAQRAKELGEEQWQHEYLGHIARLDIKEELDRALSHLSFFIKDMQAGLGARLPFLVQELLREVNTIVSKAHYTPIQHWGVEIKAILQCVQQQLHNIV